MAETHYKSTKYQENNENPTKFFSHFLYKALMASVFLLILPIFPSQAPEFINQTLHTRGWEFLHLVFVGIAVSYGIFSRRNHEKEKKDAKFDNAQSYISRIFQVSSVFDDESDNPTRSDGSSVQIWSNQYFRNEPVVGVAEEHSVFNKKQSVLHQQRVFSSKIGEKPLFLPVRSLKCHVFYDENSKDFSGSNLGSKRISNNSVKAADYQDFEETLNDNLVLPSPIPWRSRSGRMEIKEKEEADIPSMAESEFNRSFKAQMSKSTKPISANSSPKLSPSSSISSPKKYSPLPSFSAEKQSKISEDFVRKKGIHRSPPPPPTPPQKIRKAKNRGGSHDFIAVARKEKEVEQSSMERPARKKMGFEESKFKNEKVNEDRVTFMEFAEEDLQSEYEGEIIGSYFDSKMAEESSKNEEVGSSNGSDGGPDVDRKADEFIAKFREQIRLQRIASIKRSSGQLSGNSSR